MSKKELESLKKTAEAHGTLSEETSEEKAKEIKKTTEEMIEKELDKKEVEKEKEAVEKTKAVEEKEKEDVKKPEAVKEKEKGKYVKKPWENKETIESWNPRTKLGQEVKDGKIKNLDEILDNNRKILEEQIVDFLIDVKTDLISIGQSKGKFGGGKRRAWRQTQKKTEAKNIPTFSAMAVIGDENGHVGIGTGKSMETLPARDKALRKAKLNVIKIKRDCSSFDCACQKKHTVPFKVTGKAGSVTVILIPAPQGTGLVAAKELKKLLKFAGIEDVYSKSFGKKRTTFNLIKAGFEALKKTNK